MAGKVEVERRGSRAALRIDGDDFPWYIADHGVRVADISGTSAPAVTVTILARTVEVTNTTEAVVTPDEIRKPDA